MAFAIKAAVRDPRATTFAFTARKTMYGGGLSILGDPGAPDVEHGHRGLPQRPPG
jgi:hypothetical protein